MKATLALAGLVAVILLAAFLSWGDRHHAEAPITSTETLHPEAGAALAPEMPEKLAVLAENDARDSSERVAPVVEAPLDPQPKTSASDEPAQLQLSGTLVVIRADGTQDTHASGSASLALVYDNTWAFSSSTVVDGKWTFATDKPAEGPDGQPSSLLFNKCQVGDDCYMIQTPSIELPVDGLIELRVQVMPRVTARVISATSGADLRQITIAEGSTFPHPDGVNHSMRATGILATDQASPVQLPHPKGSWNAQREMWFLAPDHAWTHSVLSMNPTDERLVVLKEGGGINIWLEGDSPSFDSVLRIYSTGKEQPTVQLRPKPAEEQRVEGLDVGEHSVRLEQGNWWADPLLLAEGTVSVRAGIAEDIHLQVQSAQPPPQVDATFLLHLPGGWKHDGRVSLSIQPEGDVERWSKGWRRVNCRSQSSLQGTDLYRGSARKLYVGRYMIVVSPSEYRLGIELVAGRVNEFSIEVPLASQVEVRIVDDATGRPVPLESLAWHGPIPEGVSGYGLESVRFRDGVAKFQAPQGELFLNINHGEEYALAPDQAWFVNPGRNEITVHLISACGVRIALSCGETIPPKLEFSSYTLQAIDHTGRPSWMSDTWIQVTEPGRYRLSFQGFDGYEPVPDRIIYIPAGEMLEVKVSLTRKNR